MHYNPASHCARMWDSFGTGALRLILCWRVFVWLKLLTSGCRQMTRQKRTVKASNGGSRWCSVRILVYLSAHKNTRNVSRLLFGVYCSNVDVCLWMLRSRKFTKGPVKHLAGSMYKLHFLWGFSAFSSGMLWCVAHGAAATYLSNTVRSDLQGFFRACHACRSLPGVIGTD